VRERARPGGERIHALKPDDALVGVPNRDKEYRPLREAEDVVAFVFDAERRVERAVCARLDDSVQDARHGGGIIRHDRADGDCRAHV
jgi:hypothetical protein